MINESVAAFETVPAAKAFRCPRYLWPGLVLLGIGTLLTLTWQPELQIDSVRLTLKPGIDLSRISSAFRTPDIFVEVWTPKGVLRSATQKDAVIGGGLTLKISKYVPLGQITEIKICEEHMFSSSLVDRVDHPLEQADGEKFHFQLSGTPGAGSTMHGIGLVLLVVGCTAVIATAIKFLRFQAL